MKVHLLHDRLPGRIILVYSPQTAYLEGIVFDLERNLSEEAWRYFWENLQYKYPENGQCCGRLECLLDADANDLTQEQNRRKIALFCGMYKQHTGLQYKVQKQDISLAKTLPSFDVALLRLFFTEKYWFNQNNLTLSNFVARQNLLLQAKAGKLKNKEGGFPDEYDPVFERTLEGETLSKYWAHLRSKGFRAVKNGLHTQWIKEENNEQ